MKKRSRLQLAVLAIGTLGSANCECYRDPQYLTGSWEYASDSTGQRTTMVSYYQEVQFPSGLVALPKGGITRVLVRGALSFSCDATTPRFRRNPFIVQPDTQNGVEILPLRWQKDTSIVVFRSHRNGVGIATFALAPDGSARTYQLGPDTVLADNRISSFCLARLDSLNRDAFDRTLTNFARKP